MNREKCTAVVLAAGKGSRMGTKIQKQYLEICGKPVLYYSLAAFAASPIIDEIVLVTGEGKTDYCRKNIIEAYGITKVNKIVAGMPSKDTVKIVDENDFAVNTPERRFVWCIQTPQVFETALIRHAYFKLMENEENETGITDDAMVVERMENCAVKLVEGSYENIKITTPEDLILAESLIKKRN